MQFPRQYGIVALAIFLIPAHCEAVTSLDFDRGNGTTFTDQFSGAIGGGWETP